MNVEIICIGTELLQGHLNTNNAYIGKKLFDLGYNICFQTSVVDTEKHLKHVFRCGLKRSDMLIITGGLGPTFDDITRECLSNVLNVPLIKDSKLLKSIHNYFKFRQIDMPFNNEKMSYIFKGSKVIRNDVGTAPGMIFEYNFKGKKKSIILLPGPPFEMQPMFEMSVIPYLVEKSKKNIKTLLFRTTGLAESKVEELITPIIAKYKDHKNINIAFSILAKPCLVDFYIKLTYPKIAKISNLVKNLRANVGTVLTDKIYSHDGKSLEHIVSDMLTSKHLRLSIAESCTGGQLASKLTDIPGTSRFLNESIVAYSNESKVNRLGVKVSTLKKYGAVSKQTALEMAKGVRVSLGADIGLSITGIAGPDGATKTKPVGLVYIGIHTDTFSHVEKLLACGDRQNIRKRAVITALDILRKSINSN
ncbi:competence/damage-inducible protein A [bacterium]